MVGFATACYDVVARPARPHFGARRSPVRGGLALWMGPVS
jgi:hypothetical protein